MKVWGLIKFNPKIKIKSTFKNSFAFKNEMCAWKQLECLQVSKSSRINISLMIFVTSLNELRILIDYYYKLLGLLTTALKAVVKEYQKIVFLLVEGWNRKCTG